MTLQQRAKLKGILAERKAIQLLEKEGFTIDYPPKGKIGKPSPHPYDIVARKGDTNYCLNVKAAARLTDSFFKNLNFPTAHVVGFAFVKGNQLYMVTYDKRKEAT